MNFEFSQHLGLLVLIPIFFALWRWSKQRNALILKSLGSLSLLRNLREGENTKKEKWQIALFLGAICCFILAWANPKWGQKKETTTLRQADIIFALDVSKSMLAQDVLPNRLLRAKAFAAKLIEETKAERVGIITFAQNAYIQMPLTSDYAAAKMYLDAADTESISSQGTSIESAITEVERMRNSDKSKPVALLLISDGESHEDTGMAEAENLAEQNILFFCLGIGTAEGGFIQDNIGVKKDDNGNPIRSKLNEPLLQNIATAAGGKYFNINDLSSQTITSIANDIKNIGKEGSSLHVYDDLESQFQYFVALGLLFLSLWNYLERR
jgi:Ca-activated chloride channel family protein